jgi:hypothetical protein
VTCGFTLPIATFTIGAGVPAKVTLKLFTESGKRPKMGGGAREPVPLGASPAALMVARPQGEMAPTCPLAAFRKLEAVIVGPIGSTVRLKTCEYPLMEAVTVAAPATAPAVRVIEACPLLLVVAAAVEILIGPVAEKLTT